MTEITRGQCTPEQIVRLDELLVHHGFESSSPYSMPETVAYVCLDCGSVGIAPDQRNRDIMVENFDLSCCETVVTFHSSYRVLVDPSKLTFKQVQS